MVFAFLKSIYTTARSIIISKESIALIIEYTDISYPFISSCIVYPKCASDVLTIHIGLQWDWSSSSLIVDVVAQQAMNEGFWKRNRYYDDLGDFCKICVYSRIVNNNPGLCRVHRRYMCCPHPRACNSPPHHSTLHPPLDHSPYHRTRHPKLIHHKLQEQG